MKNKNLRNLMIFLIIILVIIIIIFLSHLLTVRYKRLNYKVDYAAMAQSHYFASRDALVISTQNYIDSHSKKSNLTALALIDKCEEYDIDLIFVLAQGQLESSFGTIGLASKTNSVWNHGAFDGNSFDKILNIYKYSHPDQSIEPYLKLLNSSYLVNKTELDLMENFVNIRGERYASSNTYEARLKTLYEKIKTTTSIDSIQKEMNYWYIKYNH